MNSFIVLVIVIATLIGSHSRNRDLLPVYHEEVGAITMLDLHLTAVLAILNVAVGGEPRRISEARWVLHMELSLERPQSRGRVERQIRPSASGQTILEDIPMIAIMARRHFANLAANK